MNLKLFEEFTKEWLLTAIESFVPVTEKEMMDDYVKFLETRVLLLRETLSKNVLDKPLFGRQNE